MRLAVVFHVDRDRVGHRLVQYRDAAASVVAESVESDHAVPWPPSPVVQQVDACRTTEGTDSLVAVGMAGVSHWSLAVDVDSQAAAISFDVACRIKAPAQFLGSTYQIGGSIRRHDDRVARVLLNPTGATQSEVTLEVMVGRVEVNPGGQLVVLPSSISDPLPATVRWKYRFLIG